MSDFDHWRPHLRAAWKLASYSPDPRTQNAAYIIDLDGHLISSGLNVFPTGVQETPRRWEEKEPYVEHAERNALFRAASAGNSTAGAIMVCGWAACPECARGIIQCGIKTLVRHRDATNRSRVKWQAGIVLADMMLIEGGVTIIDIDGPVGGNPVLHDGVSWTP
jgi:dCMP deaminase